jgi:hypothetical protein
MFCMTPWLSKIQIKKSHLNLDESVKSRKSDGTAVGTRCNVSLHQMHGAQIRRNALPEMLQFHPHPDTLPQETVSQRIFMSFRSEASARQFIIPREARNLGFNKFSTLRFLTSVRNDIFLITTQPPRERGVKSKKWNVKY